MSTNRHLAFVLGAVFVIVLVVGGSTYLIPIFREAGRQRESLRGLSSSTLLTSVQPTPPPTSMGTNSTPPLSNLGPELPPTSTASLSIELPSGWKTYRDDQHKFEIGYPSIYGLMTNNGVAVLRYTPLREPVNFYTQRAIHTQGPISAPITVAIYDKPAGALIQWLSDGYRVDVDSNGYKDLAKVQRGEINTTLTKAYAGETGILSHNESRKNGMDIYEIGSVWTNGYAISYATFFVKESLPFVYEVSFELPYYGFRFKAEPSDTEYIKLYNRIISTFGFID